MILAIKAQIRKIYGLALNTLLPPRCTGCGDSTLDPYIFCAGCWSEIHFIQRPYCHCCGMPQPYDEGNLICVNCLTYPPNFDKGRSASRYEGLTRDLILKLKHGDATYISPSLSGWMVQAGREFWADTDYLIPVPLHRWRLLRRGYNQATFLARATAKRINLPVLTNVLVRQKVTESQGHKTSKERYKNVQGAFSIKDPQGLLKGKTITLIDDVWTTGATLGACAKILKRHGVRKIYVLAFSRVVHEM